MRSSAALTLPMAVLLAAALFVPPRAEAQSDALFFDGVSHAIRGAATLGITSTGALGISNIGSSGQDGVSIQLPDGADGLMTEWADYSEFSPPGVGHRHIGMVLMGSGSTTPVPGMSVSIETQPDGSELMSADFSGIGGNGMLLILRDEHGAIVKRKYSEQVEMLNIPIRSASLAAGLANAAAREPGERLLFEGAEKALLICVGLATFMEISHSQAVECVIDGEPIMCRTIRLQAVTSPSAQLHSVRIQGRWPAPTTGSFSLAKTKPKPKPLPSPGPLGGMHGSTTGTIRMAGQGTFQVDGTGPIMLENIGSSGQDGVSFTSDEACCTVSGMAMGIGKAEPVTPAPPTRPAVHWDANGWVDGSPAPLWYLHTTHGPTDTDLTPSFGSGGYQVQLYLDGSLVASANNPPAPLLVEEQVYVYTIECYTTHFRIICITSPCPGWPMSLNGVEYMANEIVFSALSPSPTLLAADALESIEMRATDMEPIEITGTIIESSAPQVSVIPSAFVPDLARPSLYPNPAPGAVSVMFALPQAGRARVSVIDAAGRRVRSLADETFTAGAHTLSWNGRDEAEKLAPAGIYFVRVEQGEASRVARVTRLW